MTKRGISLVTIVAIVAACILGYFYYDDMNRDYTPWMSPTDLVVFFKRFEPLHQGEPDYWKKGHWITAAEGRWHNGVPQFRIRYGTAPTDPTHEWSWFWFIDQDQESFGKKLKEYAEQGYTLVHYNSFKRPDGTLRFQGVWHKFVPKS